MFIPSSPVIHFSLLIGRKEYVKIEDWLPQGHLLFFRRGRNALYHVLRCLNLSEGATVLLPSYLCTSVVAPFVAHRNRLVFYRINRDLSCDLEDILRQIKMHRPQAMLLIHYFGFPDKHFLDILQVAKERGIKLIEDCAHALFSKLNGTPLGDFGDASSFSLYKTIPMPEGALSVLQQVAGVSQFARDIRYGNWIFDGLQMGKLLAYSLEWKMGFSPRTLLLSFDYLRLRAYGMDEFSGTISPRSIGPISTKIWKAIDPQVILEKRRRNFLYVLQQLPKFPEVSESFFPIYHPLPNGVCPLGFPLLVADERRNFIRRKLYRKGIALLTLWDVLPSQLPLREFPDSKYLSEHILVLPIHQDVEFGDIDVILESLGEIVRDV